MTLHYGGKYNGTVNRLPGYPASYIGHWIVSDGYDGSMSGLLLYSAFSRSW